MKKNYLYLCFISIIGIAAFSSCKINKSLNDGAKQENMAKQKSEKETQNIQRESQQETRGTPMRAD
ncbi:MAG TPA: hypothetical protein VLZ83_07190 [Edaphocola sp.]|nr:hypothetical protein [Edaphocola sp.]